MAIKRHWARLKTKKTGLLRASSVALIIIGPSSGGGIPPMPERLKCAIRTLYEEIAEFHFDYPLMAESEAGPKESLRYYSTNSGRRRTTAAYCGSIPMASLKSMAELPE
jgi:hypothetical protein